MKYCDLVEMTKETIPYCMTLQVAEYDPVRDAVIICIRRENKEVAVRFDSAVMNRQTDTEYLLLQAIKRLLAATS